MYFTFTFTLLTFICILHFLLCYVLFRDGVVVDSRSLMYLYSCTWPIIYILQFHQLHQTIVHLLAKMSRVCHQWRSAAPDCANPDTIKEQTANQNQQLARRWHLDSAIDIRYIAESQSSLCTDQTWTRIRRQHSGCTTDSAAIADQVSSAALPEDANERRQSLSI